MGRPQFFTIDPSHQLARGLVFAGLGAGPGSVRYNDSSGRSNHGVLTGMVPSQDWVWSSQLNRFVLDLDGSDYIQCPRHLSAGVTQGTLAMWVKSTDTAAYAFFGGDMNWSTDLNGVCFASWNDGRQSPTFLVGDTDSFTAEIGTTDISSRLYHLCGVWKSGSRALFYIDGSLLATSQSGDLTCPTPTTGTAFRIGRDPADTGYNMVGQISDPMMWHRAITPSEIRQLADKSNYMLSGLIRPIGSNSNIYDREGIR